MCISLKIAEEFGILQINFISCDTIITLLAERPEQHFIFEQ